MRAGLDVILGGLLLSSGLLAPGLLSTDDVLDPSNVAGSATFDVAHYTGPGEVHASEAALEAQGPVEATFRAENVLLTEIEKKRAEAVVEGGGFYGKEWVAFDERSVDRYKNATIEIEGTPDGLLQAWPNASLGMATFELGLGAQQQISIGATDGGVVFNQDEAYRYGLPGPSFALGHHAEERQLTSTNTAGFQQLVVNGGIDLLIFNATVTISQDEGAERYRAEDNWARSDPSGHTTLRENVVIALTLEGSGGTMGFEDLRSTFFAHQPDWSVNGTLEFEAKTGHLQAGDVNRSINEDPVSIEGRTNLSLEALAEESPAPTQPLENHYLGYSPDEPETQATIDSEADNVSVAGEPMQVASSAPAIPEEVTFWGKVLGLLMLAVSVGKKLFGFIAPLVIDNPLGNDRRKRIFAFLKEAGMAHRREIHRATGIPNASLKHHLDILREHNLIVEVKENGYTVYFPTSGDLAYEDMEKLAYLADPSRRSIAEKLAEWGKGTQGDLTDGLGLSQSQVSRHLSKLVDAALVHKVEGRPQRYSPSELLRRWVAESEKGEG